MKVVLQGSTMRIVVGRRVLCSTDAFCSYWRVAPERQRIVDRRLRGDPPLWTDDPVLASYRFTNAYRASDRTSQFLINEVIYGTSVDELVRAPTLAQLCATLLNVKSLARFLAFQFAVDLNYSALYPFSEMDHVVAGPGALDGIATCFVDTGGLGAEDVIRVVADAAEACWTVLGIELESLWGRPLELVDCQHLFCELDKYVRIVHLELQGRSGRAHLNRRFVPSRSPLAVRYPPR